MNEMKDVEQDTDPAVDRLAVALDQRHPRVLPFAATEGFRRRGRALLRAAPLHDLAGRSSSRRTWGDDPRADVRTFAVAAIDAVVARSNLPDEYDVDSLTETLAGLAASAMPEVGTEMCHDLAAYVVDGLLNTLDADGSAFRYAQGEWDDMGYKVREATFRLLGEVSRADGRIVLTATVEAINALRSGLDFDVANARKANDYILALQLQNNDLPEAEITAERGLQLSIEYAAQLESDLDATRLDLTLVDWQGAVLARIVAARDHVAGRIGLAHQLLEHLDAGEDSRDAELRTHAVRISQLLERCLTQDRKLHARLQDAHDIYLNEQSRQVFARRAGLARVALRADVLNPIVALTLGAAEPIVAAFAQHVSGATRPRRPRLSDLVDDLLRPAQARNLADPSEEALPEFTDEEPAFSAAAVAAAAGVLARARIEPVDVVDLLDNAEKHGPRAAELVRCAVLWAWSPGDETDSDPVLAQLVGTDLIAIRNGPSDGRWAGDSFLVGSLDAMAAAGHLDESTDTDDVACDVEALVPPTSNGNVVQLFSRSNTHHEATEERA